MSYHLNKPNASAYYEVTVDSVDASDNVALIRYRYL